jgi:hypothetical protein
VIAVKAKNMANRVEEIKEKITNSKKIKIGKKTEERKLSN